MGADAGAHAQTGAGDEVAREVPIEGVGARHPPVSTASEATEPRTDDAADSGRVGGESGIAPAAELAAVGVSCAVVNARFVKPLDRSRIVELARRCRVLVTVEEHSAQGGFGSAVLELLGEGGITAPLRVLGGPDALIEHGESPASVGIGPDAIQAAVSSLLAGLGAD